MKTGGIVAFLTNSTDGPEIKEGKMIEKDYYQFDSLRKRYLSVKSMTLLMNEFETIILDNKGTTYKDSKKGIFDLIRYIGKKK